VPVNVPPIVQPLVVGMGPSYLLSTPFIPGVQPDPPTYIISTPVIPGITPDDDLTHYTLSTPTIPGLELPLDAGPDDLDETFLRTTLSPPSIADHMDETFLSTRLSGPDHGLYHLDETYESTTLTVSPTVDVSPVTFFPVRRKSTITGHIASGTQVQSLTVLLVPGADQTVAFGVVRA
jgi:hypothetical protein